MTARADHPALTGVTALVTDLEVMTDPRLEYDFNDELDLEQLQANLTGSDGLEETVHFENFSAYGITVTIPDGKILANADDGENITVTHEDSGESDDTSELVINPVVTVVDVERQPELAYIEGDALNLGDMVVNLTRSDGSWNLVRMNSSTPTT